jgi:L-ascorbate metabolism protein UlaG (beta-lactamase superfamily)
MIITYQGVQSFRIQFSDTVIAYNPISKESEHSGSNFGADIVLVSLNHPDFNGIENASRGDKEPFVIDGPGAYEIGGIFIQGFASKTRYDGKEYINTVYLVSLENMNLCFLGAIQNSGEISLETKEALDGIDVLFVPIGSGDMLSPSDAYKLSVKLEPAISIPMSFDGTAKDVNLNTFLKEGGEEGVKVQDKLTLKKKDLEGREGDIIVLGSS